MRIFKRGTGFKIDVQEKNQKKLQYIHDSKSQRAVQKSVQLWSLHSGIFR